MFNSKLLLAKGNDCDFMGFRGDSVRLNWYYLNDISCSSDVNGDLVGMHLKKMGQNHQMEMEKVVIHYQ